MDVLPPQPVALLQAQRVERPAARRDHAERLPGLPERVPELQPVLRRRVELPAELADIRHPERQRRDVADRDLPGREVGEAVVGEVVVADALDQVAGARPPQPQAAPA